MYLFTLFSTLPRPRHSFIEYESFNTFNQHAIPSNYESKLKSIDMQKQNSCDVETILLLEY